VIEKKYLDLKGHLV